MTASCSPSCSVSSPTVCCPDAAEIRRLVAVSAGNARALAFNAMHTLQRSATILSLQPDAIASSADPAAPNH
jgi:hypothetical protein